MNQTPFTIKPYGPSALLLEWPARVDAEILKDIIGFAHNLRIQHLMEPDWELIPIYHSLAIIGRGEADMETVRASLPEWYEANGKEYTLPLQVWELPVCYEAPYSMDLEETAVALGMPPEELVQKHTGQAYRVYGIGFLPGFLYLGDVPQSLWLARRDHPRQQVPRGSVGLAGAQTGIYPQKSPGGWHIIGNCPVPIFNPDKDPPCLVTPGDLIRFRALNKAEYA